MKSLKGIIFILFSVIITGYAFIDAGAIMNLTAGLALTTLSLTLILSTRLSFLENWFNGIEKMYSYHKITAMSSIVLLVLHHMSKNFSLWGGYLHARFGNIAIYLFLTIILIAYFGQKLKYESWRMIHRLVFVAYLFGLGHAYRYVGKAFETVNLLSLVIGIYAVFGIASGIYIIFLYQTIGFGYKGKIVSAERINHDTTELEIELNKNFNYKYGQFAFIKIFQQGFEKAPHPFSISGGYGNKIFFTIKSSGDYTKNIYENIKVGTEVKIDRAYGHMILEDGRENQVWIAGGIGITPFLSYIRENKTINKNVDFFYAYTGEENEVHIDLLKEFANNNPSFNLHIVDSKKTGFLNFDNYNVKDDTTVFMCGPVKMMDNFAKIFKAKNEKVELVYEGFKFK